MKTNKKQPKLIWTQFWDMHGGGGSKEPQDKIYIEAESQEQAELIFQNRFGHNPHRVTCTCCGEDYAVDSHESLAQLTGYHRNCHHGKDGYIEEKDHSEYAHGRAHIPLEAYKAQNNVLVIPFSEVTEEEKQGSLRQQGYVWQD